MSENISCPVSHIMVNENRVRIIALFVFVAGLSYLLTHYWAIPAFLVIDFFLRGVGKGQYSLFNVLSGWIVRKLSLKNRPIDQAPKIFAARLGFIFASLLFLSCVFSLLQVGYVITAVLLLFSFLESALGFCAGCHVYSLIKKIYED
jgi:uncharacterized protein DUF4395